MQERVSAFASVWHKREYRAFLLIMVLLSLSVSSSVPLVTLYLVDHLHITLSLAGLFFASQALPGLLLGVFVGRRSDRWPSRLPITRYSAVWVALGWLVFAFSPYAWLSFSVGAVFLSAGSITMGQAFAALHDVMMRDGETRPGLINTAVRTGYSFGWVVGPLLGAEIASLVSFQAAFVVTALLSLLCLVPLRGLNVPVVSAARRGEEAQGGVRANLLLYLFVALCALVLAGTGIKSTYLPIDVTAHLHGTVSVYGTILAVSPIVELVAMPGAGLLALRFPIGRLIVLGLVVATIEYAVLSLSNALWQLYVIQGMDALVVAVLFGLGLTYAQYLSPGRPGLASSVFGAAFGVSMILGNVIGGATVPILGVPHVFLIPTALCAIALLTFVGIDRAARTQIEPVQREMSA